MSVAGILNSAIGKLEELRIDVTEYRHFRNAEDNLKHLSETAQKQIAEIRSDLEKALELEISP